MCLYLFVSILSKMIRGIGKPTYEERLMKYGLPNLEKRRTKEGDLIEAYKVMTGKEPITVRETLFEISMENRTRGHGCKLYENQTGTLRNRFSSAKEVNPWNELDEKTVAVEIAE